MILLDVCIEPLFTNLPAEERIARIGACGFKAVEMWLHDAGFDGNGFTATPRDPKAIKQACDAAGITLNNIVINPPDDGSIGGAPVLAETHGKYLERVEAAITFAKAAGCHKAITCGGDIQPGMSREAMRATIQEALAKAAKIAEMNDFTLLLEPLNSRHDHIGYFLDSSEDAAAMVEEINSPNLRLLFDVYHMQIMEGDVAEHIQASKKLIAHYHSAAVPGRGEHDHGELDYLYILQVIAETGYEGCFGLEYFPTMPDHEASLKRIRTHLLKSGVCD